MQNKFKKGIERGGVWETRRLGLASSLNEQDVKQKK